MPTTPVEDNLRLDDAPVAFDVAGSGPAVVLLHSALGDRRLWDPQVAPLARGFTVVRIDLRGFGGSPDPVGSYAYHEQVVAVLDHLGMPRAHLAGCSFGAYVALATAIHAPARVDRLALVSPVLDDVDPTECVTRFWHDEAEALAAGDVDRAVELNLVTWIDGPHRDATGVDPDLRRRVGQLQRDVFGHVRAGTERELEPPPGVRLGEVTAPTLVLTGALDERWILDCADRLVAGIRDVRLSQIAAATHLPNLEAKAAFTAALVEHLTAPGPSAG